MDSFKITLKNYRCFAGSAPITFDVGPGFTAFVGPNNSGKSSMLRFFYELRHVFANLAGTNYAPKTLAVAGNQIEDWLELFNNENDRQIEIDIECAAPLNGEISKVSISAQRRRSDHWPVRAFYCNEKGHLVGIVGQGNDTTFGLEGNKQVQATTDRLQGLFSALRDTMYIGPFRNAITEGSGSYYDLSIGTSFIEQWNEWKTGGKRTSNIAVQQVTETIAHIFGFSRLEINASSDRKHYKL